MFGRLAPSSRAARSFYEDLRTREDDRDVEEDAGLNVDEENLRQHFNDFDAEGLAGTDSRITVDSAYGGTKTHGPLQNRGRREPSSSRWPAHDEDADNDVPASLLVEHNETERPHPALVHGQTRQPHQLPPPTAGPSSARSRAQWEAAATHQRLHDDDSHDRPTAPQPRPLAAGNIPGGPKENALWRWVNTSNLDRFMRDVYDYYEGGGMWCILNSNALWLLSVPLPPFCHVEDLLTIRQQANTLCGCATDISRTMYRLRRMASQ